MSDPTEATGADRGSELLREATTMALYVSLSLLAVLLALPLGHEDDRLRAGLIVLLAGSGLVLAHHVAFRISSRLVDAGLLSADSVRALKAQAAGGLPVAVLAAVPVFLLGEQPGVAVAEVLLVLFIALVGYRSARQSSGPVRSLVYVGSVVLATAVVLVVKLVAGH